jgi:hypothetical protein
MLREAHVRAKLDIAKLLLREARYECDGLFVVWDLSKIRRSSADGSVTYVAVKPM